MAVDKKSDYVGNHGGSYVDNDGLSKQFTYVDHDKKTKISSYIGGEGTAALLFDYKLKLVDKILQLPPSLCPQPFQDFTLRGDRVRIEWNEVMLRDEGVSIDKLRDLHTLISNKQNGQF